MLFANPIQNKLFSCPGFVARVLLLAVLTGGSFDLFAQSGATRRPTQPAPDLSPSPSTRPPAARPETSRSSEAGPPLKEAEFFNLVKQAKARTLTQGDLAGIVEERGIAFEAGDSVIERAKANGAQGFVVAALLRAEERRKRARYAADLPPDAPPNAKLPDPDLSAEEEEPSEEEQLREVAKLPFIEQARYFALREFRNMPDFVVKQTVRRFRLRGAAWEEKDVLGTEVTYENQRGERIKLETINDQPTAKTYEQVGGTTSVGEFFIQLISAFREDSRAKFTEVRRERYRGRDCTIYDFAVSKDNSNYSLEGGYEGERSQKLVVGFQGSVWIDKETKRVLRIEQAAADIPRAFILSQAETAVEYDWVEVAGKRYWLPQRAEALLSSEKNNYFTRNVMRFYDYRKFEGDVKIVD